MTDVLDEILDRLPPSTVRLILDFNKDRLNYCTSVNNLIHDTQQVKLKHISRELKRKTFYIKSKVAENKNYLSRLKDELEVLNSTEEPKNYQQSLKAYEIKINELQAQIRNLTKDHDGIDLTQLFNEIEDLDQQIEVNKKKLADAKSHYRSYDNFPPDIEQAKEAIAMVKERIKQHELVVESFL